MFLTIDSSAAESPYEQLRAQVEVAIAHRQLPPGARLPTVRRLAADLGLAPGTVARAYRELEVAGLVITRGRHGTFVSAPVPTSDGEVADAHAAAAAFVADLRAAGLGDGQILDAVRGALARAGGEVGCGVSDGREGPR